MQGPCLAFSVTMASGGTLSSEIDLANGWSKAHLVIPTMASNSEIRLKASSESGGTFRQVYHPPVNSATVAVNMFKIASGVTNATVEIPAGLRYLKVETTATIDSGLTFKVICS